MIIQLKLLNFLKKNYENNFNYDKVWQIFTNHNKSYKDLKRHKRWVWSLLYEQSSNLMFSGGADNTIRVISIFSC